jgi:hypothetical protein
LKSKPPKQISAWYFLSKLVPGEGHISDMLIQVLLNPEMWEAFPLDQMKQSFLLYQGAIGFESTSRRPLM